MLGWHPSSASRLRRDSLAQLNQRVPYHVARGLDLKAGAEQAMQLGLVGTLQTVHSAGESRSSTLCFSLAI
jgi:hypothetical protein